MSIEQSIYFKLREIEIKGLIKASVNSKVYIGFEKRPIKRKVAVKVINTSGYQKTQEQAFYREIESVSGLNHPNVVKFFHCSNIENHLFYIVMECIDGGNILEYIKRSNCTPRHNLDLVMQLCSGLKYIHNKGVVHADLKPENILVDTSEKEPKVKIIDFGLSQKTKQPNISSPMPQAAEIGGTLGYLDPYRLHVNMALPSTSSDIYALGIIIFEIFSGVKITNFLNRLSKTTSSMGLIMGSNLNEKVRIFIKSTLSSMRNKQQYMNNLFEIILKCIAFNPDDRYLSLHDLQYDLQQTIENQPLDRLINSPMARLRQITRNNKPTIQIMCWTMLFLAGLSLTLSTELRKTEDKIRAAFHAKKEAEEILSVMSGIIGDGHQPSLHAEATISERVYQSALNFDQYQITEANKKKILEIYARLFKNTRHYEGRSAAETKIYLATIKVPNIDSIGLLEAEARFGTQLYYMGKDKESLPFLLSAYNRGANAYLNAKDPSQQITHLLRTVEIATILSKIYRYKQEPQKGLEFLLPHKESLIMLREQHPKIARGFFHEYGITLVSLGRVDEAEAVYNNYYPELSD
ncbi:serine/threonine-protein kinase [Acanthopleuribacter pedis]|uniref:Serine/threonine protein kinase n=1 Tax=Acanthopleuribacter pedis TaxID=442870 RepID=A0A8J7Q8E5_9BACT|nr:serine/threonine-protein kinase [Acanthopleuribacter pedis]MBO1322477.1 serine/threonine protein kinase [Acanthopleuribacter pedis]